MAQEWSFQTKTTYFKFTMHQAKNQGNILFYQGYLVLAFLIKKSRAQLAPTKDCCDSPFAFIAKLNALPFCWEEFLYPCHPAGAEEVVRQSRLGGRSYERLLHRKIKH